jgi:hypothetical protein
MLSIGMKFRTFVGLAAVTAATALGQELPCGTDCGSGGDGCVNTNVGTTSRVVSREFWTPTKQRVCRERGDRIRVVCTLNGSQVSDETVTYWTGVTTCTIEDVF